jgi:hypothetical protein
MAPFTVLILHETKPELGYVVRRGAYVEMLPTTKFTPDQLNQMTRIVAPKQKYMYIYPHGELFHSIEQIDHYVNS